MLDRDRCVGERDGRVWYVEKGMHGTAGVRGGVVTLCIVCVVLYLTLSLNLSRLPVS